MSRPFSEEEPRTVAGLVSKYEGTISVSRVPNNPLINVDINLPLAQVPEIVPCPPFREDLEFPPDFEECKGSMRLELRTSVHPFEKRGVMVTFRNEQIYVCEECGVDSGTEDITQSIIIGRSITMIREQFTRRNILVRSPSINEVRRALEL